MKKLAAIALILLLLFNVLGFYSVFYGLQYQNDYSFNQLDFDHPEVLRNTVLLKIPMAIPYGADQKEFQRAEGEFEHEGEFFRLVSQRFDSDTLHLICIRDEGRQRIHKVFSDFVKTFTDKSTTLPVNGKQQLTFSFIKEYISTSGPGQRNVSGWWIEIPHADKAKVFLSSYVVSIVHPPERIPA